MKQVHTAEHWFTSLKPEQLASAVALYREPLFRYTAPQAQEMHILFVGTGHWMDTFLRLTLVVGQMLNKVLHVHVLAPDADGYRDKLFASAPELQQYADVNGSDFAGQSPLVVFDFANQAFLNTDKTVRLIGDRYLAQCHYIVADLENGDGLLQQLAARCSQLDQPAILLYTGSTGIKSSGHLKCYSLSREIPRTAPDCVQLSRLAFRLHYYYERQYRANKSIDEVLDIFTGKVTDPSYSPGTIQFSNLTAILHMKYKLASIGINPNSSRQRIMQKYARLLYGSNTDLYHALSALEHRRWLMEKVLAGFRKPSLEEMLVHCFDGSGLSDKWWNEALHFHNCLVPSTPHRSLRGLTFEEWDEKSGVQLPDHEVSGHIAASGFDALDQASLGIHYLARKKMSELIGPLRDQLNRLRTQSQRALKDDRPALQAQLAAISGMESDLELLMQGDTARAEQILSQYQVCAEALQLSQDQFQKTLKGYAKLARDYYGLRDYKDQDDDVIDLLCYVYIGHQATILKIGSQSSILDNIASSLLIEPEQLILVDAAEKDVPNMENFFRNKGGFLKMTYSPLASSEPGKRMAQLKAKIRRFYQPQERLLIIDLTGASGLEMLSITDYVRANAPKAAIITCDCKTQTISNIHNFPESACIRMKQKLHTDDVFCLIGASRQARIDTGDALRLRTDCDRLWQFYTSHADKISEVTEFVRGMVNCSAQSHRQPLFAFMPASPTYQPFQYSSMPGSLFNTFFKLREVLDALQQHSFIKDLRITSNLDGTVSYSGEALMELYKLPAFRNLLALQAKRPMRVAFASIPDKGVKAEFTYSRDTDRALYVNVVFQCGTYHQLTVRRRKGSAPSIFDHIHNLMAQWADAKTIDQLSMTSTVNDKNSSSLEDDTYVFVAETEKMRYLAYNEDSKKKILSYHVSEIQKMLRAMLQAHLIEDLKMPDIKDNTDIPEIAFPVSFSFTSHSVLNHLSTPGSFLESRIFAEAVNLHLFDHVDTNYKIAWNDAEHPPINEFDVLCVKGLQILLISAKATDAQKEHMYEVMTMAQRLSHTAQPILVYSSKKRIKPSLISRAQDLGVMLAYAEGGDENETIAAVLRKALER